MDTARNIFLALFLTLVVSIGTGFAQEKAIARLHAELVSPWLVTVEGDARSRTLTITNATQKSDEVFSLDAMFGFSDGAQPAATVEVMQIGNERKLTISAKSGARIVAAQAIDGSFIGTFTTGKGEAKAVTITKISKDEQQAIRESARVASTSIIEKPAADVPASCASFSGKWTGTWTQGGVGQNWLWVAKVEANCTAKIAYLGRNRTPSSFETVDIKDGVLQWLCNQSTGGTCVLKYQGDELLASYSNPSGGVNNAVFRRIP